MQVHMLMNLHMLNKLRYLDNIYLHMWQQILQVYMLLHLILYIMNKLLH